MAYIKQNSDDCSTELWLDGEFQASWREIEVPDDSKAVIEAMIDLAVEHGKHLKAKEVREIIGA